MKAPLVSPVTYEFELIACSKSWTEISFFIRLSTIHSWFDWPVTARFLPSYWKVMIDLFLSIFGLSHLSNLNLLLFLTWRMQSRS